MTLGNNKTATSSYYVLSSLYYSSPNGSGGTYNISDAADSIKPVLTYNYTTTTFDFIFRKTTGNIWTGGIHFLVVYL